MTVALQRRAEAESRMRLHLFVTETQWQQHAAQMRMPAERWRSILLQLGLPGALLEDPHYLALVPPAHRQRAGSERQAAGPLQPHTRTRRQQRGMQLIAQGTWADRSRSRCTNGGPAVGT